MNHFDGAATRSRNNLLSVQKGTKTMQTRLKFLLGAVAAVTVSGCTAVQDTFQVGEREFSFDTVVEVQESGEARSEEHTSELQSRGQLVCRLLLVKTNRRNAVPG